MRPRSFIICPNCRNDMLYDKLSDSWFCPGCEYEKSKAKEQECCVQKVR